MINALDWKLPCAVWWCSEPVLLQQITPADYQPPHTKSPSHWDGALRTEGFHPPNLLVNRTSGQFVLQGLPGIPLRAWLRWLLAQMVCGIFSDANTVRHFQKESESATSSHFFFFFLLYLIQAKLCSPDNFFQMRFLQWQLGCQGRLESSLFVCHKIGR